MLGEGSAPVILALTVLMPLAIIVAAIILGRLVKPKHR
jgi:ABC-type uncharacterized transport system permease subunit